MSDKPREMWIDLTYGDAVVDQSELTNHREAVRYIEYSAYEALARDHDNDWKRIQDAERALEAAIARSAKLVEALKYYAAMRFNSEKMEWMPGGPEKAINAIAAYVDTDNE